MENMIIQKLRSDFSILYFGAVTPLMYYCSSVLYL
jgi:hypothetical protein